MLGILFEYGSTWLFLVQFMIYLWMFLHAAYLWLPRVKDMRCEILQTMWIDMFLARRHCALPTEFQRNFDDCLLKMSQWHPTNSNTYWLDSFTVSSHNPNGSHLSYGPLTCIGPNVERSVYRSTCLSDSMMRHQFLYWNFVTTETHRLVRVAVYTPGTVGRQSST